MKRSGIRDAMPMIYLSIPGFRKAASGLQHICLFGYGWTLTSFQVNLFSHVVNSSHEGYHELQYKQPLYFLEFLPHQGYA